MITDLVFQRPNRIDTVNKDEKYHTDYAKWVLSCINTPQKHSFNFKSVINWSFYKGNQWMFSEDLDAFLLDESGEARNRIKFVQNIVRPFVEYYTGSAIRLDITATAQSISSQAIDRKEQALDKVIAMTKTANQMPPLLRNLLKDKFPIGDTEEETTDIHRNLYKDKFVEDVNNIIGYLAGRNDVDDKKVDWIRHIVLDGIGIAKEYERFGTQIAEVTQPSRFFFDGSAKRRDLKDSEFMGEWNMMSVSDICERFPKVNVSQLRKIEKESSINMNTPSGLHSYYSFEYQRSNGKIPVYEIYWKDIEVDLWGAVKDIYGNPMLVKIDGEKWTEKDLIKKSELKGLVENNDWIEKALEMNQTKKVYTDVTRYCIFIPSFYIANTNKDIVLDYGIRPYDVTYSYDFKFNEYPYKCSCWSYHEGDILSPIDDLISPQRFINRILSMGESQVNNTRASVPIFDKDAIDGMQGGEEELQRNINLGKAVIIDAGGQVNNAVSTYNNTLGSGTLQLFQVADTMKKMADGIIGGGDALQGSGGAYRASATVASQNLNQGTIMQEPVFYCLYKIIIDLYTSFGNRGRRILANNQSKLNVVVGSEGVKEIQLTKEFELEEFRVVIEKANNPLQEREAANNQLMILMQSKLIDQDILAKYYNKATLASIGQAIREYAIKQIELQRQLAKQQEQMQAQQQERTRQALHAQAGLQNLDQQQQMQQEQQQLTYGQSDYMNELLKQNEMTKGLS